MTMVQPIKTLARIPVSRMALLQTNSPAQEGDNEELYDVPFDENFPRPKFCLHAHFKASGGTANTDSRQQWWVVKGQRQHSVLQAPRVK